MRFLIDMPVSPRLAEWLGRQGHEAVHAVELGLSQAADSQLLERARVEGRVVVTMDLDYPRLLALGHADSPGLILFRNGDYSENDVTERLREVLEVITDAELAVSVVVVERTRIRRRRLPM